MNQMLHPQYRSKCDSNKLMRIKQDNQLIWSQCTFAKLESRWLIGARSKWCLYFVHKLQNMSYRYCRHSSFSDASCFSHMMLSVFNTSYDEKTIVKEAVFERINKPDVTSGMQITIRIVATTVMNGRDRVNAEIVHFYAKKCQKMQHQNFNASQDARCWLTPLTLNVE